MSTDATRRAEYVAALPTFAEAAALIMIDPSGVSRAVKTLGVEPIPWGNREKHLAIADVFRIAIHAKRAALEEVGTGCSTGPSESTRTRRKRSVPRSTRSSPRCPSGSRLILTS
jgi:hypothetical protein